MTGPLEGIRVVELGVWVAGLCEADVEAIAADRAALPEVSPRRSGRWSGR